MGKVPHHCSIQMVGLEGEVITLKASREDVRIMEITMRAGCSTDPIFRLASDEATAALQQKMFSVLNGMEGDQTEFCLTQREFLDVSSILAAVNTMDSELYYPDMVSEFPPDDVVEALTQHIHGVYAQAFRSDG